MLSPTSRQQLEARASAFEEAEPFRHVVLDEFLEPQVCQQLLQEFPGFEARYALNEMGQVGGKAVRSSVAELGATYAALDRYIQSAEFLDYVSRLTGIPDLLYDPDYEGGGTHENRDGQSLDVHIDFNYHPRTGFHRRLNLIIYLNPEWEDDWGGALQLVEDPWDGQAKSLELAPLFNRCVVFETNEVSWHGFREIELPEGRKSLSRKSFAIYLYTRTRPAEQTAPPHATVYVPDGMPTGLQSGSTLDDESVVDLRVRFARLRGQLRFLYQREGEFSTQIERLKGALAEARTSQRINLQGYASVSAVDGCWPDGWVSRTLVTAFETSRALRGLSVDLWVPPQLTDVQKVSVGFCGGERVFDVAPGARETLRLSCSLPVGSVVELRIRATQEWVPASDGESGDERALAWRLLGITLEH